MTATELLEMLTTRLARSAGGSRARWRQVLGPVKIHSLATHPSCNWSLEPSGPSAAVAAAQALLDDVRLAHPFVDRG